MIGTYERVGQAAAGLLRALPHLTVVEGVTPAIIDLVAAEVTRDAPGQGAVLDRLLDVLTVAALRSWFDDVAGSAPGWWRAADDPVAGPAVRLVQHNPGHPWTVASLAAAVGVSRALLARRFTAAVGQPPMAFLTEWRLALAADLLLEPGATVQQVASRVGYGSGFALSAAFKRVHGESPTAHRRRMLAS
jgi:AraC-like DNA-binding protein